MKFSKIIIALITAGVIGLFSFSSAQAVQSLKSPVTNAATLIEKVSHHGSCYKYKYRHGHKYCYKFRYKKCYKWRYDSYGNKYCYKWGWGYYTKPYYKHGYKKHHGHGRHGDGY